MAIGLFAHILRWPATNKPRRIIALCLDMGFLCAELHVGDEIASALAPIYLWVILGNGFRFGVAWLRGGAARWGCDRDRRLAPKQREMARTATDAGHELLGLIDGILDFSRIEAGRVPVSPEPVALAALLQRRGGSSSAQTT